jgi:dihydrofolate reductase
MTKVILHVIMSLDGFMATAHDKIDWSFQYGAPSTMAGEVRNAAGAIVLGERTFDVSMATSQPPYGGAVKVPLFVVTHKARSPQVYEDLTFTFVTDGVERAVERAKVAAGNRNVVILGGSIYQQSLTAGLVDEIVVHVVPILLGDGVRVFDKLGTTPIKLERIDAKIAGQLTDMRFKVVK